MTKFEIWTIVISAVSAVVTFGAVCVALWQSKLQYKRNIIIGFRNNRIMKIDGKDTPCFDIVIYNVGNAVCAVEHILLNKLFSLTVERKEQLFIEPQMINSGETVTFICRFDYFMLAVKAIAKNKKIKKTTPLVIYTQDITGKFSSHKIGNTVGEYLAWNEGKISLLPKIEATED